MNNLPPELQYKVFSYVNFEDGENVCLVCKDWKDLFLTTRRVLQLQRKHGSPELEEFTPEATEAWITQCPSVVSITMPTRITDANLACLKHVKEGLRELYLKGCTEIKDEGLAQIIQCTNLETLGLENCGKITNEGLEQLQNLPKLRKLEICECMKISEEPLFKLTQVKALLLSNQLSEESKLRVLLPALNDHLEELTLYCNRLNNSFTHVLSRLTKLRKLEISSSWDLSDDALQHLSSMESLESLTITWNKHLTGRGLEFLAGLPKLTSLSLSWCFGLTEAGMASLEKLEKLHHLSLRGVRQLPPSAAIHIAHLSNLTSLDLCKCGIVSPAALAELRSGLPNLRKFQVSRDALEVMGLGDLKNKIEGCPNAQMVFANPFSSLGA